MSHKATNWAIQQRGLKPASKIVLWHLADRHNPDFGCFPSQELLASDCEMSRSTLNVHLKNLEGMGLIQRIQKVDKATGKQKSTHYILGFEIKGAQARVRKSDMEAVSEKQANPCPKNDDSRVLKSDTNPVREPLIEPCALHTQDFFNDFLKSVPRVSNREDTRKVWDALIRSNDPKNLISAAKVYAQKNKGNESYCLGSVKFLSTGEWQDHVPEQKVKSEWEPNLAIVQMVKAGRLPRYFDANSAQKYIHCGALTEAQCQKVLKEIA